MCWPQAGLQQVAGLSTSALPPFAGHGASKGLDTGHDLVLPLGVLKWSLQRPVGTEVGDGEGRLVAELMASTKRLAQGLSWG